MPKLKKVLLSSAVFAFLFCFSLAAAYATGEQTGKVTCSVLNVRASASTNAAILDRLTEGAAVTILSSSDGWYRVSYEGGKTGWVYDDYISLKDTITGQGAITGSVVNIRTGPGTSYSILTTMKKGEKASVFGRYGEWYKIKTSDEIVGWVINDYFAITGTTSRGGVSGIPVIEPTVEKSPSSSLQAGIVDYARKFIGSKYVYGGSSPSGFDCSGFAQYVFKHFGISLNRVAADQAGQGTRISKAQLQPGDLVFFDTNGGGSYINHVGIYIGNGDFIHASNPRYGVTVTDITSGFYARNYITARRIVK